MPILETLPHSSSIEMAHCTRTVATNRSQCHLQVSGYTPAEDRIIAEGRQARRKQFFFEKKNQKTFIQFDAD
jgi:hypothetical protein